MLSRPRVRYILVVTFKVVSSVADATVEHPDQPDCINRYRISPAYQSAIGPTGRARSCYNLGAVNQTIHAFLQRTPRNWNHYRWQTVQENL
jgi:hypothetical protein